MNAPPDHENGVSKRLGSAVSDAVGLSQSQDEQQQVGSVPTDDVSGAEGSSTSDSDVGGDDTTEREAEEAPEPELPLDQVFEILKNSRRRETLHYLEDNGGEASLSDLAEHIAALENDTTVAAISSSQRKRVYVGLYQCHLPKMDDMDIIDFNQNRGTIVRAHNADQLVPYLEDSTQPPWHRMYGSITVAGGGLFLLSVFGNAPLGLTPTVVLAALVAAMALCSIAHARHAATEE